MNLWVGPIHTSYHVVKFGGHIHFGRGVITILVYPTVM